MQFRRYEDGTHIAIAPSIPLGGSYTHPDAEEIARFLNLEIVVEKCDYSNS